MWRCTRVFHNDAKNSFFCLNLSCNSNSSLANWSLLLGVHGFSFSFSSLFWFALLVFIICFVFFVAVSSSSRQLIRLHVHILNLQVNGKNENPIYTFLKSRCPSVRKEFQAPYKLYYDPYHQDDIRYSWLKSLNLFFVIQNII